MVTGRRILRVGWVALALAAAACGGGDSGVGAASDPITRTAGDAELVIPAGALPDGVAAGDISIEAIPQSATFGATEVLGSFRLTPSGLVFDEPAVFTYRFPLSALGSDRALGFYLVDDAAETIESLEITDCDFDVGTEVVTCAAAVPHFSTLTITVREPAFSLEIELDPAEAAVGETVSAQLVVWRQSGEELDEFRRWIGSDAHYTTDGGPWWLRGDFVAWGGLSPGRLADRPPRTQVATETFTLEEAFACTSDGLHSLKWLGIIDYGLVTRSGTSAQDSLVMDVDAFISCRAPEDLADTDAAAATLPGGEGAEVGWAPGDDGCWSPSDLDLAGLLNGVPGSWTWTFTLPAEGAPEGSSLGITLDGYDDEFVGQVDDDGFLRIHVPVLRPGVHRVDGAALVIGGHQQDVDPDELGPGRTFEVPDAVTGTGVFDPSLFEAAEGVILVEKTADTVDLRVVWAPNVTVEGTAASGAVYDLGGGCTVTSRSDRAFTAAADGDELTATGTHTHEAVFFIDECPGLEPPQVPAAGTLDITFDEEGGFTGSFLEQPGVYRVPFVGSLDPGEGTCAPAASE